MALDREGVIVWLYALMHNEQALLPYFLRHYERVCDRIILYDHGSTDDSRDIAAAHPLVEVRRYEPPEWDEPTVTAFINGQYREARGQADWVIWVDVDEFLYHPQLRNALWAYRNEGVTLPIIQGYGMMADEFPAGGGQLVDLCKMGVPDDMYSKRAVFHPDLDLHYGHGRHHCTATGNVVVSDRYPLKLLHYRYFGPDWLAKRNARHYARLSERNKANNWSTHTAPGYTGRYSQAWYDEQAPEAVV